MNDHEEHGEPETSIPTRTLHNLKTLLNRYALTVYEPSGETILFSSASWSPFPCVHVGELIHPRGPGWREDVLDDGMVLRVVNVEHFFDELDWTIADVATHQLMIFTEAVPNTRALRVRIIP